MILNFEFLFNFQTYLESSVSFSYVSWLNDLLWLLYLSLNVVLVIGLYRDDGLAVLKSATGSESERMRKRLIKTFQDSDLSISSQTNITSANFLDITLNLTTESYKPYRKPNDQPLYIDKYSNHPRHIIKTLTNTISKRISELSSTKKDFEEAAPIYIEAMKQAKHDFEIKYAKKIQQTSEQKNRKRNITWY